MTLDASRVDEEKKALEILIESLEGTEGKDREVVVAAIQAQAEKLQKACDELQAAADELQKAEPEPEPEVFVEIKLTPEQRAIVKSETGVDVPSLRLKDPSSNLTKHMHLIQPEFVLKKALEQAKLFNEMSAEAEELARELENP